MSKGITAKLEERIVRITGKLIPKKVFQGSLEKQVKLAMMMMGMSSMEFVRKTLLRDMPEDIVDMLKSGKTKEEIKAYYWGCEEFRECWEKTMVMTEGMLDLMIDETVQKKAAKTGQRV